MSTKLWEALDIMRQGGLAKGVWRDRNAHCLIGALAEAEQQIDALGFVSVGSEFLSESPDIALLASVAQELFPERTGERWSPPNWEIVASVSDHRQTTQADAELIIEKAAIKRDEVLS